MKGKEMLYAMNYVNQIYVEEAEKSLFSGKIEKNYVNKWAGKGRTAPYVRYFAAAACLCLALLGALRLGGSPALPGPDGPGAVIEPPVPTESQSPAEVSQAPAAVGSPDPLQPPQGRQDTIQWRFVAVNESEGLSADGTRLYMDPALYEVEHWDMDQVRDYFGWELAPAYIPEDLTGGGQGVGLTVYRDKATGELIEDQAGRGFWVDYYEDGSPKSDDDIVIPKGFTVKASKLGILHCALLPVDEEKVTQFDRTDVVLTHASLPYGPFDPTQKDPSGLYNMPAGYYDIYVASFTLDGVEYEVECQRMELEELIRIVASIISPTEDIIVGVGCGMPGRDAAGYCVRIKK